MLPTIIVASHVINHHPLSNAYSVVEGMVDALRGSTCVENCMQHAARGPAGDASSRYFRFLHFESGMTGFSLRLFCGCKSPTCALAIPT